MNFAPRTSFCFLGLSGLLYLQPPITWLTRDAVEEKVVTTQTTFETLSLFLEELSKVIIG